MMPSPSESVVLPVVPSSSGGHADLLLGCGHEQLQGNAVRVVEVQMKAEGALLYARVVDARPFQPRPPVLEFLPIPNMEGRVVQADAIECEAVTGLHVRMLSKSHEEVPGKREDRYVADAVVALKHLLAAEYLLVPGRAS